MLTLKHQGSQIGLQSHCVPVQPLLLWANRNTTHPLSGSLQYLFGYISRGLDKWALPTKSSGDKAGTTPNSHHHFLNLSSQSFLRTVFGLLTYRISFLSPIYALCMPMGRRKLQQAQSRCLAQGFSGRPWCCRALGTARPCWECPQLVAHRAGGKCRIIIWEGAAEKHPPPNNKGFIFA